MKTTVLYHNDNDGFGAAFALWLGGIRGEFIAVQYGQEVPPISSGTEILYIVDFSYDRKTCGGLASKYKLIILDHHATAEKELEGLPYAHFDSSKSGAGLAWEHLHNKVLVPEILMYVQDRDLWEFELPYSEEVNLYIDTLEWDFEIWKEFSLAKAFGVGKILKKYRDQQIEEAVGNSNLGLFHGHVVPIVNTTVHTSEIGHALLERYPGVPFAVMFFCDETDNTIFSLRSRKNGFDVGEFARSMGGGGHTCAAGFKEQYS